MTITLMLEKPFFTSKFSHEGMIKRLEEHIKKTINTFFSLKFIPRNIKWLFWIERSSFREKHFQQKEQPEKKPTESRNNLDIWEHTSNCSELRMGVDDEILENRAQQSSCAVLGCCVQSPRSLNLTIKYGRGKTLKTFKQRSTTIPPN